MGFFTSLPDEGFRHESQAGRYCDLTFEVRGRLAPFVEVTLAPDEGVVCEARHVLQHDEHLEIKSWPGLIAERWLVVNSSGQEGSVMLGTRQTGFAGAFDLTNYHGRLVCPALNIMANGPGVTASFYARFANLALDLVLLEGNGWAFLRAFGDVFAHDLAAGEQILMRAHGVAAMTATVNLEPVGETDGHGSVLSSDFAVLTGPGTIWLQSHPAQVDVPARRKVLDRPLETAELSMHGLALLDQSSA